jgi:hypothetical protein
VEERRGEEAEEKRGGGGEERRRRRREEAEERREGQEAEEAEERRGEEGRRRGEAEEVAEERHANSNGYLLLDAIGRRQEEPARDILPRCKDAVQSFHGGQILHPRPEMQLRARGHVPVAAAGQGLTLVHFSAQREHVL